MLVNSHRTQGREVKVMAIKLDENGFTLIEILVAIAIFSIGMLGIAAMQIHSTSANTTARISTEQTAFATDLMEKLTRVSYDDFPESGDIFNSDEIKVDDFGLDDDKKSPDGYFAVECTVDTGSIIENTKTLDLTVTDLRRGGNRQLTLSHIIPRM